MKNWIMILVVSLSICGCSKPLSSIISARVENGCLMILTFSPDNETWYNRQSSKLTFNEEETQYLRDILRY